MFYSVYKLLWWRGYVPEELTVSFGKSNAGALALPSSRTADRAIAARSRQSAGGETRLEREARPWSATDVVRPSPTRADALAAGRINLVLSVAGNNPVLFQRASGMLHGDAPAVSRGTSVLSRCVRRKTSVDRAAGVLGCRLQLETRKANSRRALLHHGYA